MKVYNLDLDSGERDPLIYLNSNSFTISLKTPVYNVSNIEVVSVRLPRPRTIGYFNNKFTIQDAIGTYDVTIDPLDSNLNSYTQLASYTQLLIRSSGCDTINDVSYTNNVFVFSNTLGTSNFSLNFYSGTHGWSSNNISYTTPNQMFGFPSRDIMSSNGVLRGNKPDIEHALKTFILKISSGSSEFNQDVYTNTPFYTGVFLNTDTDSNKDYILFKSQDDPFLHEFNTGIQKEINSLTFEWFHKENNKLIPIDFNGRDYAIKLKLYGNTDKLESLPKVSRNTELPPPISIPELENPYRWKEYASIALIIFVGIIALMITKRKPRITPE